MRLDWRGLALGGMVDGQLTVANAQSSVTLYGLIDEGVDSISTGSQSLKRLISGGSLGSRLGFRGAEDLGDGLSAVFRLEMGVLADDGTIAQGGRGFGRESSVGLSDRKLGTLSVGRLPMPYYSMQSNVDAFQWGSSGGMLALTRNTAQGVRQVLGLAVSARSDNAMNYVTPSWGGFEGRVQIATGEGSPIVGKTFGFSGRYTSGPVDMVLGYHRLNGGGNEKGQVEGFVVGGSYDAGPAKVFFGATEEKNSCATCTAFLRTPGSTTTEFRLINLGVRVPIGPFVAIGQVVRVNDRSKYTNPTGDRDATWISVGGEYYLSKRTLIYGSLASISNSAGSQYVLGSGTAQQPATLTGSSDHRSRTITLGIRHSF